MAVWGSRLSEGTGIEGIWSELEGMRSSKFDKEKEGSVDYLDMIPNKLMVCVVWEFVCFNCKGHYEEGSRRVFSLVSSSGCRSKSVLRGLTEQNTPRDLRQKMHKDTQRKMQDQAIAQRNRIVPVFEQTRGSIEVASRTSDGVKRVGEAFSLMERDLFVDCWWFGQYVSN